MSASSRRDSHAREPRRRRALPSATAQDGAARATADDTELGPVFLLSLGGKLYDDFWTILDELPPEDRNPALSGALSVSRRDTWRCVTCHGWDYSGADDRGQGSSPGLTAARRRRPGGREEASSAIRRIPSRPTRLTDTAMDILALFVTQGQYDAQRLHQRDAASPSAIRNSAATSSKAPASPAISLTGARYLKGEKGDRSSLGWVSRNRPEQAIHKILNGVPAAEMLSLRFLSDIQIADLLAYLQSLDPNEN